MNFFQNIEIRQGVRGSKDRGGVFLENREWVLRHGGPFLSNEDDPVIPRGWEVFDLHWYLRKEAYRRKRPGWNMERVRRGLRDAFRQEGSYRFPDGASIDFGSNPGQLGGFRLWLICPISLTFHRKLFRKVGSYNYICRRCAGAPYLLRTISRNRRKSQEIRRCTYFLGRSFATIKRRLRTGKNVSKMAERQAVKCLPGIKVLEEIKDELRIY